MLRSFQSELGTISSDMKRLQKQSVDINQQLQNRQKIRGELSQFVDDMVVSQNMIRFVLFYEIIFMNSFCLHSIANLILLENQEQLYDTLFF